MSALEELAQAILDGRLRGNIVPHGPWGTPNEYEINVWVDPPAPKDNKKRTNL